MKHFGIITYYFPPNNSVGVRRVSYIIDYLLKNGHKVTVFTFEKNNIPDIYKKNNCNVLIFDFFKGFIKNQEFQNFNKFQKSKSKTSFKYLRKFKRKFINPFFGQLFDPRFFYIVPFCFYTIKNKNELNNIDYVFSTTPPYFVVLLSIILNKIIKKKLIIDIRDQFSNNPMFSGKFSYIEKKIDKACTSNADLVLTVSNPISEYYKNFNFNVKTIYNGFDEQIFKSVTHKFKINKINNLVYFGTINHKSRIPLHLIEYLEKIQNNIPYLHFYGENDLLKNYLLQRGTKIYKYFKFHDSVKFNNIFKETEKYDGVMIFEEKNPISSSQFGTIPTKVFESIALKKPIYIEMSEKLSAYEIIYKSGLLVYNFSIIPNQNVFLNVKIDPDHKYISQFSRLKSTEKMLKALE